MSISTEIARLQNAKDDIKTSIESKGVTIPNGTTLDDYSKYIDNIEEGENIYDYFLEVPPAQNVYTAIKKVPFFDTSNMTNLSSFFYNCIRLVEVPELDTSSCIRIDQAFKYCSRLEKFGGFKNLGAAFSKTVAENYSRYTLDLSASTVITHDSLMNVINNLYNIASKGVSKQKVILSSTSYALLSSAEIAIATNKGWTISTS